MLRIVHCADVHLETTFPQTRGGARRRRALADAFARIVDVALERDADVLTIGGDLYEAQRTGPQTVRFLFEQIARFGGPVYVAPGNHDPYERSSPLARADRPANLHAFDRAAWHAVELAPGVTLFGFAHTPAEPGRLFANAHFGHDGFALALAHGSDEERCPPGKRATAPFTATEVLAANASLLLTGHYHGGYVASSAGRPVVAYPGSPEPIRFGEAPVHGALLVTLDGGTPQLEALPLARTRVSERTCDLTGVTNDHAVAACVDRALDGCNGDDFVRLRLRGAIAPGTRIDTEMLAEAAGPALGSLELVDDTAAHDLDVIAREPTVRGHVVRDLLARGPAGEAALRLALAAFDGSEIAP